MRPRTTSSSATVLGILMLALPTPGLAQEPGVTVDPDSPTGKEYSIPLDSARDRANPPAETGQAEPSPAGSGAGGGATTPEPDRRFGEGIDGAQNRADRTTPDASTEATTPSGGGSASPDGAGSSDAAGGDGSPFAWAAAGLLAAGAIGGGLMRGRRRR